MLTEAQKKWIETCKKIMGDPIGLDHYLSNAQDDDRDFIADVVNPTCQWWEMHASDQLRKLQNCSGL